MTNGSWSVCETGFYTCEWMMLIIRSGTQSLDVIGLAYMCDVMLCKLSPAPLRSGLSRVMPRWLLWVLEAGKCIFYHVPLKMIKLHLIITLMTLAREWKLVSNLATGVMEESGLPAMSALAGCTRPRVLYIKRHDLAKTVQYLFWGARHTGGDGIGVRTQSTLWVVVEQFLMHF